MILIFDLQDQYFIWIKSKESFVDIIEFWSLVLLLYMLVYFSLLGNMDYDFFLNFFLTMSVCEGALGLSLLVLMVRVHGNDIILSFNSLW